MSDNQNQLQSDNISHVGALPATDFQTIYRLLAKLDYHQQNEILALEQQLYGLIKQNTNDISGLIILMQEQIMRGEHPKAKALAYKIWDMGGDMQPDIEALFISNLINLGLIDMAGILLKPKIDSLTAYAHIFFPQLLKYAVVGGNISLISRLAALDNSLGRKQALKEFVNVFNYWNATEQLQALQRSLLNMIKDVALSIDYNIYTDRGFTDLEIVVYVGKEAGDCQALQNKLEMQITAFCVAKKLERFNNLSYVVRPINEHLSLTAAQQQA